jgi:hypothetical protein
MKENNIPLECINKWVLFNKDNEILFCNEYLDRVILEGEKYGVKNVVIQRGSQQGTCFF